MGKWLQQGRASRQSGGGVGHRTPRRDGPRSWVVAIAAFASMFFSIGLSFGTVGVMTVAIGERFQGESRSDLSWVGGLRMLFTFCTGIASSALHSHIGSRRLQIIGAVIVCVATGLSSLSTELWHMYVTFGALAGVGLSMVFTSASVAVDGLFDRYLHVALPLSQLGGAVGMSVFPALARAVVSALGFRGSVYVLCGLSFAPALWALLYVDASCSRRGGDERSTASGNGADVTNKEAVCSPVFTAAASAAHATSDDRNVAAEEKQGAATAATSLSLSTEAAKCLAQALQTTLIGGNRAADNSGAAERQMTEGAAAIRHSVGVAASGADLSAPAINRQDERSMAYGETTDATLEVQTQIQSIASESAASSAEPASAISNISTQRLSASFPIPETPDFRKIAAGSDTDATLSAASVAVADLGASEQRAEKQPLTADKLPMPARPPLQVDESEAPQWRRTLRLLAVCDTWLGLLHFFCRQYASSAIVVLLPTLASSAGRLPAEAGTLSVTILFAATVPGLVTTVALGARALNRILLAVAACTMLGAATMVCAPAWTSVGSFYPLCAFTGYWLGMILGLFMSVVKELSGARARLADVFGLTAFALGLGGLAGPAVSGILLTIAEPEVTLYATGGVAILAGVALIAPALRRPNCRPVSDSEKAAEVQAETAAAAAGPVAAAQPADAADSS